MTPSSPKNIAYKIIGLFVKIRYSHVPPELRYFYKETLYCRFVQIRYFFRDFIFKKKYKTISFSGEFGAELQFALPFAYWHFKNGTLKKTQSSKYTRELYFFSENHEEIFEKRSNDGNINHELPRVVYSQDYNMGKWARVPLKEHYSNDIYKFEKPVLVIANRYNMEWDGPPLSFFSIPMLSYMIDLLKAKYTIIYNRPRPQNIITDESDIYDLNEFEWLEKEYPEVILMEDLFRENKGQANNFNHLQMLVYANAERFICTHGGTSVLASCFGGTNLIFSKAGPEHHFNCYQKLYPQLSGARILHAKTEEEIKTHLENHYV